VCVSIGGDADELRAADPEGPRRTRSRLPVSDVLTMDQSIGKSTMDASFTSSLVLAFRLIALVLAAVGLYGVLVLHRHPQRTGEIGIRIALGAARAPSLRSFLAGRPAACRDRPAARIGGQRLCGGS